MIIMLGKINSIGRFLNSYILLFLPPFIPMPAFEVCWQCNASVNDCICMGLTKYVGWKTNLIAYNPIGLDNDF